MRGAVRQSALFITQFRPQSGSKGDLDLNDLADKAPNSTKMMWDFSGSSRSPHPPPMRMPNPSFPVPKAAATVGWGNFTLQARTSSLLQVSGYTTLTLRKECPIVFLMKSGL